MAATMARGYGSDEDRDVRVEDFLNDKLQTASDLANIDTLLEDVRSQQVLLQQQVSFVLLQSVFLILMYW